MEGLDVEGLELEFAEAQAEALTANYRVAKLGAKVKGFQLEAAKKRLLFRQAQGKPLADCERVLLWVEQAMAICGEVAETDAKGSDRVILIEKYKLAETLQTLALEAMEKLVQG